MDYRLPFTPSDTFKMVTVRRLRLHPSEDIAAILYRSSAGDRTHKNSLHWVTGLEDGSPSPAWDPLSDLNDFQWSPSGDRFLTVRTKDDTVLLGLGTWSGGAQLDRVDTELVLPDTAESLSWSSDGSVVAFCARLMEPNRHAAELIGTACDDVVLFHDLIPFKHERQDYWAGKWYQLFVAQRGTGQGWQLRQLTHAPIDHLMPSVSPDGRTIAFVSPAHGDDRHWGNQALMGLDIGTGEAHVISEMGGPYWHPTWAPSGGCLAWLGHDSRHGKGEATDTHLWVRVGREAPRDVSSALPRTLGDVIIDDSNVPGTWPLAWSADERELYGVVTDGGRTALYRFPIAGSAPPSVVSGGDRRIFAFAYANGTFLLGVSSPTDPCQVVLLRNARTERMPEPNLAAAPDRGERPIDTEFARLDRTEEVIASPNAYWLRQRTLTAPHGFTYHGARGDAIEGWLIPPVGRDLEGAPLVLQLNRGRWGWSFYLESQILASHGFAVAFVNPHGSYGYGEVFRSATHYDPAGLEMEDFLLAVDHLIGLGIDPERVGINGTSFGGFSVNWLAAHHSERFRAGVAQASYCNRHNLWGSSSIGPSRWDRPGPPWENADFLLEKSPLSRVAQVSLPLMIIHGERDTICPLEQAEQWYTALTICGQSPTFLILRDEGHDLARTARPSSREVRMTAILRWFQQHLLPDPSKV